jgi:hypothetical protein
MRRELEGVEVVANAKRERYSTSVQTSSAYVVTLISVLESRALTLVSAYVANIGGETAVTHLRSAPGQRAGLVQRPLAGMAGETHLRACLLEHASELRDFLQEIGGKEARVDIAEVALEQAAAMWRDATQHR